VNNQTTQRIPIEGKVIDVDDLPKRIRETIDFFDRVNADLADITYKHTVFAIAANALKSTITSDVTEWDAENNQGEKEKME
jgi:hypothetical protein